MILGCFAFTFDATSLDGKQLVTFEELYDLSSPDEPNSGLYNTGRLGAQGLYNISTPVSNPQPGDLVFFTGTYDTPGVSHVGIYVGEDGDGSPVMLHCGDPIQYSKLDTSYWQSHFYAYGRLNYN